MKSTLRPRLAAMGVTVSLLTGCAQNEAPEQAFTVRKIESVPAAGEGAVRVKLVTAGDHAEADADLIVRYVQVVAVHEATKRQRQIAESRARAAWRKISARRSSSKPKPRYIAVTTEKSTGPKAAKAAASVMIWDTSTQEIVGNGVYDVRSTPPTSTTAQFETFTAEFVGGSL